MPVKIASVLSRRRVRVQRQFKERDRLRQRRGCSRLEQPTRNSHRQKPRGHRVFEA